MKKMIIDPIVFWLASATQNSYLPSILVLGVCAALPGISLILGSYRPLSTKEYFVLLPLAACLVLAGIVFFSIFFSTVVIRNLTSVVEKKEKKNLKDFLLFISAGILFIHVAIYSFLSVAPLYFIAFMVFFLIVYVIVFFAAMGFAVVQGESYKFSTQFMSHTHSKLKVSL